MSFAIIMGLLNLFVLGLLALIVIGIVQLNWLYIVVGFLGFGILLFEDIKLLSYKIVFFEDCIFVPSSNFDRFLFGQKKIQNIQYADIKGIELKTLPVQILFIQCKSNDKPNAIYVKQYSKNQIQKIMEEINLRLQQMGTE